MGPDSAPHQKEHAASNAAEEETRRTDDTKVDDAKKLEDAFVLQEHDAAKTDPKPALRELIEKIKRRVRQIHSDSHPDRFSEMEDLRKLIRRVKERLHGPAEMQRLAEEAQAILEQEIDDALPLQETRTDMAPGAPEYSSTSPAYSAASLAYALGKLDTGITAGMLNTAAELLIEQKGEEGPKLKMVYKKFDFWPAAAVPLAFKSLRRPFVWKKLKGDEVSDTKLKRLLNSKGRFVVDGYMAKEFLWKDEKEHSRDERKVLHDHPPSESRHAIAVKNGRVYCRNLAGKQEPKVNSVLHIGPKMKTDGYLCLIAKVYKLQE